MSRQSLPYILPPLNMPPPPEPLSINSQLLPKEPVPVATNISFCWTKVLVIEEAPQKAPGGLCGWVEMAGSGGWVDRDTPKPPPKLNILLAIFPNIGLACGCFC